MHIIHLHFSSIFLLFDAFGKQILETYDIFIWCMIHTSDTYRNLSKFTLKEIIRTNIFKEKWFGD